MADKIQWRRDTAANWTAADPVLRQGEPGYELDTQKLKIGDGVTAWDLLPYSFGSTTSHGALTGLGNDDHTQYLTEARHDTLPSDNPHAVTKAQVGLSNVPNVDSTDRANHTGTQLSSTISDFLSAVQASETTTTLALVGNSLNFTDEDGATTNIDLSLYLDDTNLARLVSGTLNPVTGVVTFTRDDSSTFTIDMSALLDNQIASEVPVTPTGNISSTDTQAALEELQGDIDALGLVDISLQSQITTNDNDITLIQSEQTTQNTNISTNQSDISGLQTSQSTQDTAIALNTAKVSADGPVSTHSDVDTAGVQTGDQLEFDGANWVPKSILNGFTIFPIWAEENGGISNNQYEWSWGNGATGAGIGIVIPFNCELFAVSFNAENFGTSVSIDTELDGVAANLSTFLTSSAFQNFTPVAVTAGQRLGFRTNTVNGGTSDVRVCAWLRVKATAAFPTPDRNVVSGSSIAFVSPGFTNIPGMSVNVTLTDTGTIDGIVNYSALRSGATNSESQFRVVINGDNGQTFFDTLSTFNDTGSAAHYVQGLPAGTYTVTAQAAVDNPITITSISLSATALEN